MMGHEHARQQRRLRWEQVVQDWARNHASDLLTCATSITSPVAEVGFLGLSGVGKSSLLNALVSPGVHLTPAGGIGPLTGSPVRFSYGDHARAVVRYRAKSWLVDMLTRFAT